MDVVALLGTRWAVLEEHGTRWRAVLSRWVDDPHVRSVTVVDYPAFTPRALLTPTRRLVTKGASWLAGVEVLDARVPVRRPAAPPNHHEWRRTARALESRLESPSESRVLVAATPLWAPVLPFMRGARRCFDGVDDWRGLAATSERRRHIDQGYEAMTQLDVVTTVSTELARRFADDFLVRATTVPNGVDLSLYRTPRQTSLTLPSGPFVVYVGVVEARVDLDLVKELVATLDVPVVIAGPVKPPYRDHLASTEATWLGPIPVDAVAGLLQRAAVGIVPHYVTDFTASMNPMKVLEYLAAGLPVVATEVHGLSEISQRIVAVSREGFVAAVQEALVAAEAAPRRLAPDPAVADRDWDSVAARLLNLYADRG